jgi:hypothetical protein
MFRNHVFMLFVLSLFVVGQTVTARAADACQPVLEAMTKIVTTSSHSYTTHTGGSTNGKPVESETIYVNGKVYVRVNGKWMNSPVTAADVLKQEKENRAKAKGTCQFIRNETVNGEPAMVYAMNQETEYGKEEAQMWISRATGLALREEQDVDRGVAEGKEHRSARFEYRNVKPPM